MRIWLIALGVTINHFFIADCLAAQPDKLIIFTYEMPGLIVEDSGTAAGPAVETIDTLMDSLDIRPEFVIQPFARVTESVKKFSNACAFPVDWSASRAKDIGYLLPLTHVQPTVYALAPDPVEPDQLQDKFVVTLNTYASQYKLDEWKASKILVSRPSQAFALMLSKRVDYLLMDKPMADAIMSTTDNRLFPVLTFASSSTWLVCNKESVMSGFAEIEQHFLRILQKGELENHWRQAGVHDLYLSFFGQAGSQWRTLLEEVKSTAR